MKKLIGLAIILLSHELVNAQRTQDIKLGDRLKYHFRFDGDLHDQIGTSTPVLTNEGSPEGQFFKGNLKYADDKFIQLGRGGLTHIGIREELSASSDTIRTYGYWIKIDTDPQKVDTTRDSLGILLSIRLFERDTLSLKVTALDKKPRLVFTNGATSDTLQTLSQDKWYYCSIQVTFSTDPHIHFSLFETATSNGKPTLQEITIKDQSYQQAFKAYIQQAMATNSNRIITLGFYQNDHQLIQLNDLRIYGRDLSKDDIDFIAQYSVNDQREDMQMELAIIYKKLADELYMSEDRDNATKYYHLAAELTGTGANSINVNKLNNSGPLYSLYYKLLQKDIAYRTLLLESGYTFWGIEFSQQPLIPTNEIATFQSAYTKFENLYTNIESLIKYKDKTTQESVKNMIQQSKEQYTHEINLQKNEIANTNIDFYGDQILSLKNRLKAIEEEQKELSKRVKGYEDELKKNEQKIVASITKAVSECAIGVRINSIPDLSKNFKQTAFDFLETNPEIKNSLLGSANDIFNTAQASYDYYNKAKQGLEAIKATINGKNMFYPDQIMGFGDALSEMGLLSIESQKEWNNLKKNYRSVEELKSKATEIIAKAAELKNGGFDSWVKLTDYVANSGYFPEYEGAFNKYTGFPRAAFEAFQEKKYDALLKLGSSMLDTILNNPDIKKFSKMKDELKSLSDNYSKLKPLFTAIQMSGRDSVIKAILIETIFDPKILNYFKDKDPKYINDFLWEKMQALLTNNNNLEAQEIIFKEFFAKAPNAFTALLSATAKSDLRNLLNVTNDNDLFVKLKTLSNKWTIAKDGYLYLPVHDDVEIRIKEDTLILGIYNYKLYFDPTKIKLAGNIIEFAKRLMSFPKIKSEWTSKFFTADFAILWQDAKLQDPGNNPKRKQDIYEVFQDKLKASGNKAKDTLIQNEAYKLAIGTAIMENYRKDKGDNLYKELPSMDIEHFYVNETQTGDEAQNKAMRDMAARAVDMAFPGVGTAISTVMDLLGAVLDNSDLVDQLKDAYNKKIALRTETLNRLEQLQSARRNSQIAVYEKEIAQINLELSSKRFEEYNKLVENVLDDKLFGLRRKISIQLPIFYYYAERLRYYYHRLNKASSFWYGADNTLDKLLYADNSNLRLALDESIRLFEWIETPDISSSRQDIDSLHNYWQRHAALVENYDKSLKFGSADADETEIKLIRLELSKDFAKEWKDLDTWKKGASYSSNPSYKFPLDLSEPLSNQNRWNLDASNSSIKTVMVAFLAVDKDGRSLDVPMTIAHPGVSLNENGDLQLLKRKVPKNSTEEQLRTGADGPELSDPNVIQNLRNRWVKVPGGNYIPAYFEGYNFRSKWELEFRASPSTAQMDKCYFVFATQSLLKGIKKEDDKNKYLYLVKLQTIKGSQQENYQLICSPEEYERYESAIKNALLNKTLYAGSITKFDNNNSTEIYGH